MRQLFIRHRISLVLKIFATLLLFSVVWIFNPELPEGEVAGQWLWLAQTGILYSIIMLVAIFLYPERRKQPTEYYYIIIWSLIAITSVEAVWGILQFVSSAGVTGSFHSEKLYAGYLAVIFPVCLNEYLKVRKTIRKTLISNLKYYSSFIISLLIALAVLTTNVYSAWFTLLVSSLFIGWYHFSWKQKFKEAWHRNPRKVTIISVAAIIGAIILSIIPFSVHLDETKQQLFLTKISFKTIAENPLTGYGSQSFQYAYGKTQEYYFANNTCSEEEKTLAGSPLNASNEYLHGAIEWGIPIMLGILFFVILSIHQGIKFRRIGVSGGVLALLVFSFFANPMQIPAFIITVIFLLMACIMGRKRIWLTGMAIIIGLFGVHWWRMNDYLACKEWSKHQQLYYVAAYQSANRGYEKLYSSLNYKPDFLYEHAFCLHKLGRYDESNKILEQASRLSNDPMIHNVMGRNYQLTGNYKEAEECFIKSANMVPGRMLPYYFLAKLYNEPGYKNPAKCKEMAHLVLEREKNVQTSSARQMRQEAKSLLNQEV